VDWYLLSLGAKTSAKKTAAYTIVDAHRAKPLAFKPQPSETHQTKANATERKIMVKVPTPIPTTKVLGVKSASVGAKVGIMDGEGVEAIVVTKSEKGKLC
jgi:hypothetical protein